jgi:hypothetical protein
MADSPSHESDDSGAPDSSDVPHSRPLWVRVFGAIILVIAALFMILKLVGGEHGPGRHMRPRASDSVR